MGVLATVAWWILGIIGILGLYCVLSAGVLLFLDLPEDPAYGYLVDVVFILTLPFVIGVVAVAALRQ